MQKRTLHAQVRARLAQGILPRAPGSKTYAGLADGPLCDCCGAPIVGTDVQYEVDFGDGPCGKRIRSLVMHRACHEVWMEESAAPRVPAVSPRSELGDMTMRDRTVRRG